MSSAVCHLLSAPLWVIPINSSAASARVMAVGNKGELQLTALQNPASGRAAYAQNNVGKKGGKGKGQ